jgi:hypothetical protein
MASLLTKAAKIAIGVSVGVNSAFGVSAIAQGPKTAESIAGDVVNTGGQIGIDTLIALRASSTATSIAAAAAEGAPLAAAGPPGWVVEAVIFIFQITGILIDSFLNPFKTYFNSDLRDLKQSIDLHLKKLFISRGSDYPLEIKPNMEFDSDTFRKYLNMYFTDNGIISSSDIISEEDISQYIKSLTRLNRLNINPLYSNINTLSSTSQNIALLIATAAAKKKGYQNLANTPIIDPTNYKKNVFLPVINWSSANWQLILILICILLISSCVSIVFSTSDIFN